MNTAIEVDLYKELGFAKMRFKLFFRVSVHVPKVQPFKPFQPKTNKLASSFLRNTQCDYFFACDRIFKFVVNENEIDVVSRVANILVYDITE